MGCGQSRLGQGIQALPRPKLQYQFDDMVRMCRHGSLTDRNLSKQNLLKDGDSDSHPQSIHDQDDSKKSSSFEAKPLPERVKVVKVTVAPHLQVDDEPEKDIDKYGGLRGHETKVEEKREHNVAVIAPRAAIKDDALVKENLKKKEMEEEEGEEKEEDENKGDEEDRWIGRPGSPSFRIYLVESTPSDEEDDDVKDSDTDKTSVDEDMSIEDHEVSEASVTKTEKRGRGFMKVVRKRRLSITSCCNSSHQKPPEQR